MAAPGWPDETKDPLLGSLPEPLVSLLIDNGWNTAVRLEAAFDTEAEAESLVTQLQGHNEARNVRRFWAKALMSWQALVLLHSGEGWLYGKRLVTRRFQKFSAVPIFSQPGISFCQFLRRSGGFQLQFW